MASLKEKIQKEMTEAMKAREAAKLQTMRLIWNGIRKKEIDDRKDLSDAEIEKVLLGMIKQVQETLEQAQKNARAETIAESEFEIKILKSFLPEAMTEAEVLKIVNDLAESGRSQGTLPAGNAAMGFLMKEAMVKIGSRSEGKIIQAAVRKALGL